jgi:MSHA pilin protein MshC
MAIDDPKVSFKGLGRCRRLGQWGFTMIELIMVIILLGILSVVAMPRIFNSGDFYARGFHDETMGLMRYAQKTAIAQRRTVCVAFTTTTATLSIASAAATGACNTPLIGPNKSCSGAGCITAKSGISYSAGPTALQFDGLGQPTATPLASMAVQVANNGVAISKTVTIEPSTGYVHD